MSFKHCKLIKVFKAILCGTIYSFHYFCGRGRVDVVGDKCLEPHSHRRSSFNALRGSYNLGMGLRILRLKRAFSFLLTLQTVINKHVKQTSLHHKKRSLLITKHRKNCECCPGNSSVSVSVSLSVSVSVSVSASVSLKSPKSLSKVSQ